MSLSTFLPEMMMGGQVTPEGKEYNMDVDVQWKSFVAFNFNGNLKKKESFKT